MFGPLLMEAPASTITAANKNETGNDRQGEGKNFTLSSKHELVTSDSTV